MVPWARVRWLPASADRNTVMTQVSQERFSRWPVVEPRTGRVLGYLLTKDLVAHAADAAWSPLVRPLKAIHPDESVESVLARMQSEGDSVYLVEDEGRPLGLITQEDILEQVVGRIEDEYPHEAPISVADAMSRGGITLHLAAVAHDAVIAELAEAIPQDLLPSGLEKGDIIRQALEREKEISTDLGNGVAVPHARVPGLNAPIVVLGRSADGVVFSPASRELVRLVFLLVTPSEQPEAQLALLSQIATACRESAAREALLSALTPADVLFLLRTGRQDSAAPK